jgi:DnaJ family protein C protein 8
MSESEPNSMNTNAAENGAEATTTVSSAASSSQQQQQQPQQEDWEVQRDHHKKQGDNAFRCGGFKTAIDEYGKAISLDPDFIVAYSNRSAAYLKNSEKSKALKDAETIVRLDPNFSKGHSRLAAALHALRRYPKALEAYQAVLKLDPENKAAKAGVEDCEKVLEVIKQEEQRQQQQQQQQQEVKKQAQEQEQAEKPQEKEAEEEGDDLDDFFAEMEEVATPKPAKDEGPKATNAIKNDRETLGTSETQMEFLLRDNYEWRNLNPFYVLQLPHEASEDDISRRYKALSLLLHPDKNYGSDRAQLAYDQVQKAKSTLSDPDRAKHMRLLVAEGMKQGDMFWKKSKKKGDLKDMQEKEVMRIFAMIEQKRKEVEGRERKYEQRERQQEDDELDKERQARKFDKNWREEERVGKRVGNWRDFASKKKKVNP